MLVEQLALTYKCHSAIGNSLELEEMLKEVLKTFLNETFAMYSAFYKRDEDSLYFEKVITAGRAKEFEIEDYEYNVEKFSIILDKYNQNNVVMFLPLKRGVMVIIYNKEHLHLDFLGSMFQGLAHKLNIAIDACLNMHILKEKNEKLNMLALELEKQRKELYVSNEYKNDFLANISHELKTPLNSIILLSSVMKRNKRENLDKTQVKNLDIINSCGNDLLYLINDILDISKIEAGEINLDFKHTDIKEVMETLYESMFPQSKIRDLEFIKTINIENSMVYTDEVRLNQILKNLLSNAFKFTKKAKVELRVDERDEYIEFSIIDEGIGIPQDKLEHIFDRFKQADGSTTREYGGTGLGLAICKELAFLLEANLIVNSKVGTGSEFKLIIPKKSCNIKNKNMITGINQKNVHILIVDCDHVLLMPILIHFKKMGVQTSFLSLEDKIDNIKFSKYDAVLIVANDTNTYASFLNNVSDTNAKTILVSNENDCEVDFFIQKDEINKEILTKIESLIYS